jgi:hypothetical protein
MPISGLKTSLLRLMLAAVVAAGFGVVSASPAAAVKYVAMGDSYSAGTGLNEADHNWSTAAPDKDCHRSHKAYPALIRGALGASSSFKFAACTGARTNHITGTGQHGNPAQVNAEGVAADTLDITISIGGNDAGFGDVLLQCGLPLVNCDGDIDGAQNYINNTLPGQLNTVYNSIKAKAPNARVGVLGYPRLFPADGDDCSAATFFSEGEINRLNQTADMLADATRARARAHGFTFIDSRPAYLGHAWCEAEWINGLSNPTHKSFHPNEAGYVGFAGITRAAMLAAPARGFQRGPNGRLVFERGPEGSKEVFVSNGNGTFPVNLTANAADDRVPAFSPDGTRIVFASDRDGDFELFTMNVNGGGLTKLTNNTLQDFDPAWSPNGKQIVFRRTLANGNNEIFKMNADGSSLWDGSAAHNLTNNAASDFAPAFSPDGSEIAFQRYVAGSGTGQGNEVFKMSADGQGQANLTNNAGSINDGAPQWSPDGTQIAFHSNRTSSNFDIYTMSSAGGTATRRTTHAGSDRYPTWAPSGSHIAFQSNRTDDTDQIFTMTATGASQTRRTTGDAADQVPSWQGDATAPQTVIDVGPQPVSNNPAPTFEFSADELGSTFECRFGSAAFQPCTSPFTSAPLDDGSHTFAVRATDPSGNLDTTPATRTFQIDTSAKVTEITAGPSGPTNESRPSFEFSSEDASVTFECRFDHPEGETGGWADCESPYQPADDLSDGPHRFEVRGTDAVGNVEPDPQVRTFTVDTVDPATTITFAPAAISSETSPTVEFAADEEGVSFECRLTAGSAAGEWLPCQSGDQLGAGDPLVDGEYTFEVRATDLAGNQEAAPQQASFTVDTVAPAATIAGPGAVIEGDAATFTFTADDPAATFECRLDSTDDTDWSPCGDSFTGESLNHGRHSFQVRATDRAGNVQQAPATYEFAVKNDPAYTITSKPAAASTDPEPVFEFTSSDPDAEFECRLDSDAEADWEPCGSPFEVADHLHVDPESGDPLPDEDQTHRDAPLAPGPHRFEVRATDWFGERTDLPAYEWTIVTEAPAAEILTGPAPLSNSRTAAFTVAPGLGATALECQLDGTAWQPCGSGPLTDGPVPVEFTGLFDQTHNLKVRSRSALFAEPGPVAEWDWTIDATAPVVNVSRAPARNTTATTATFEFGAVDPGASNSGVAGFRCRIDGIGDFEPCTSPHAVPGLADGEHRFEVLALDEAGNTSQIARRDWTVDTTAPAVNLGETPPASTEENTARFGFTADDPQATFECRLNGSAWQPCSPPETVGPLEPGEHRFEVRATDSLGNAGNPAGHAWSVLRPVPPAPRPGIKFSRQARVKPRGATPVATASCPGSSPCRVVVPRKAVIKLGGKRFKVKVKAPKSLRAGRSGKVKVIMPAAVRRALGKRTAKLKLKVTVVSGDGPRRALTRTIRLRR